MLFLVPWVHKGYWPVVTTTLIGINVFLFLITWPLERRGAVVVDSTELVTTAHAMTAVLLHPESGISDVDRTRLSAENDLPDFPSDSLRQLVARLDGDPLALNSKARYELGLLYPRFKAMDASLHDHPHQTTPLRRFGFRPAIEWFPGLVTHMFLHGGWMHLLGNMLFLWVIGNVLEERIGLRILGLYAIGGLGAALVQAALGGLGNEYLIGASGAISAFMGFGCLTEADAPVGLFYMAFSRAGHFTAPLWIFVALWVTQQLSAAMLAQSSDFVQVGYAAHFGGLITGMVLGGLSRGARHSAG